MSYSDHFSCEGLNIAFLHASYITHDEPHHELTDHNPMMRRESLMTKNPAYMSLYHDSVKLPLYRSFPESSTTFCDPDPPSMDNEDDHQYYTIPATPLDCNIHKSADESPLVDDPAAKIDSIPQ